MERPEPKASSPSREIITAGPCVALHDARCGNSDHAAVPAIAVDHHAVGFAQRRFIVEPLPDVLDDAALFVLAVGIELIEAGPNFARSAQIFDAEQIDYVACARPFGRQR